MTLTTLLQVKANPPKWLLLVRDIYLLEDKRAALKDVTNPNLPSLIAPLSAISQR